MAAKIGSQERQPSAKDAMRYLATLTLLILLAACGGGGGGSSTPSIQTPPVGQPPAGGGGNDAGDGGSSAPFLLDSVTRGLAAPAVASPTGEAAMRCAVMLREDEFCTLNDLSLLGMETTDPTIDDIMRRVVVTHDWMAVRFRELLELMPPEVLLMMRGLTAVVISSDVRPSFYTARTGAIYLDPAGMWLTEAERAVISTADDPRTEDIQAFQFLILWRYVLDGTDIRNLDRSLESLSYRAAALLFHELAHANDYFPPGRLGQLDPTIPIYNNISTAALPSTQLANSLPLQSGFMRGLAAAAFRGVTPSAAQLATTADEVAAEFPLDIANDYYNYSTSREDLAMAFEEAMMLLSYGIDRDVGIVAYPGEIEGCNDLLVAWGQRNRIAESSIGPRSQLAVDRILPEASAAVEDLLASLDLPLMMQPDVGWCANIDFGDSTSGARALTLPDNPPIGDNVHFLPHH